MPKAKASQRLSVAWKSRIVWIRCLECEAVFTVLPSFVVRYKRYDTDALEKFMTMLFILSHIHGATVDGWHPAQDALKLAFPGLTLQECLFHATHKLGLHLATYKRQRKAAGQPLSEQEEECLLNWLAPLWPVSRGCSWSTWCCALGPR